LHLEHITGVTLSIFSSKNSSPGSDNNTKVFSVKDLAFTPDQLDNFDEQYKSLPVGRSGFSRVTISVRSQIRFSGLNHDQTSGMDSLS
jgi:hypothetical protein